MIRFETNYSSNCRRTGFVKKRQISQSQYISTIQSQMWEYISDAFSDKLKCYGNQVVSNAKQIDPFIKELSDRIEKLSL